MRRRRPSEAFDDALGACGRGGAGGGETRGGSKSGYERFEAARATQRRGRGASPSCGSRRRRASRRRSRRRSGRSPARTPSSRACPNANGRRTCWTSSARSRSSKHVNLELDGGGPRRGRGEGGGRDGGGGERRDRRDRRVRRVRTRPDEDSAGTGKKPKKDAFGSRGRVRRGFRVAAPRMCTRWTKICSTDDGDAARTTRACRAFSSRGGGPRPGSESTRTGGASALARSQRAAMEQLHQENRPNGGGGRRRREEGRGEGVEGRR